MAIINCQQVGEYKWSVISCRLLCHKDISWKVNHTLLRLIIERSCCHQHWFLLIVADRERDLTSTWLVFLSLVAIHHVRLGREGKREFRCLPITFTFFCFLLLWQKKEMSKWDHLNRKWQYWVRVNEAVKQWKRGDTQYTATQYSEVYWQIQVLLSSAKLFSHKLF